MKKRLLFINHSNSVHGAETVLLNIISLRKNEGDEIFVVSPATKVENDFKKAVEKLGVSFLRLPFKMLGRFSLRSFIVSLYNSYAVLKIVRFIRKNKIDIVFTNTSVCNVGVVSAKLTKVPHIWHFHESANSNQYGWHNSLKKFYVSWLNYEKNTVVFISNNQRKDWESVLNIKIPQFEVIYNPINEVEPTDKTRSKEIVFGYIGNIEERKNLPLLQNVFYDLNKKHPYLNLKLKIAGTGHAIAKTKKLTKELNLDGQIEMLGYTTDITSFYSNIDVLVLPSWEEMMPLVVLEAMSAKIPVLLTKNTGLNEIFTDKIHYHVFEPKKKDELFSLMEMLLNEEYRAKIAKQGYLKTTELNVNEKFKNSFNNLFDNIQK